MWERPEQPLQALKTEGGRESRIVGVLQKLKSQEDKSPPTAPRKEHSTANASTLVQWDPFQTFDLKNYKIINLCHIFIVPS